MGYSAGVLGAVGWNCGLKGIVGVLTGLVTLLGVKTGGPVDATKSEAPQYFSFTKRPSEFRKQTAELDGWHIHPRAAEWKQQEEPAAAAQSVGAVHPTLYATGVCVINWKEGAATIGLGIVGEDVIGGGNVGKAVVGTGAATTGGITGDSNDVGTAQFPK